MLKSRFKGDKKLIALTPDKIDPSPYQPRKEFDYYELLELSKSIKENGMIQPVTVRKKNDRYELISGERRLRAAAIAGLKTVPAIVVSATDRECSLMCLIENIQRTDLNFFEEAKSLKKLMDDFDLSGLEVAERIGMAQSTLSTTYYTTCKVLRPTISGVDHSASHQPRKTLPLYLAMKVTNS